MCVWCTGEAVNHTASRQLGCVWCTGEAVNHTASRQLGCVCGVQVKLSIIHLVGSGGVSAERAACLLITAAADSRHR